MKYIFLVLLTACGSLKQDLAPAPIELNEKRVETIVCGSHQVGENGCLIIDGVVDGTLSIYKINEGSVRILGLGCGVDESIGYNSEGEWLDIDLRELVGDRLDTDCVLTITQTVRWKSQDRLTFPIKQLAGTVTLGTCSSNFVCSITFEQSKISDRTQVLRFKQETSGAYMLSGCGRELIKPTDFKGELVLPLGRYYQDNGPGGCMFILAVRGQALHKVYQKVNYFADRALPLQTPSIEVRGKRVFYKGDPSTMFSSVNGNFIKGANGKFIPLSGGDTLRFFTSQGRTLVVFVKDGRILWTK
jgi:hypothetical protein